MRSGKRRKPSCAAPHASRRAKRSKPDDPARVEPAPKGRARSRRARPALGRPRRLGLPDRRLPHLRPRRAVIGSRRVAPRAPCPAALAGIASPARCVALACSLTCGGALCRAPLHGLRSRAALCVLAVGLRNVSTIASASDPSGYVSQAQLWLAGDLRVRQPDVGRMPWPGSEWTFSPLGYRPDAATATIVPTYAPGLPLLMAAATLIAGACGPYLLGPLCAALLVWATYAIGARLSSAAVGLVAALAVAVSPAVLFMSIQPMSDVPTAAFWTLSMLFAGRGRTPRNAVLAGVTAGVAILIRPNLAPLAAIPALLIVMLPDGPATAVATRARGALRRWLRAVCRHRRGGLQPPLWLAVAFGVRLAR